MLQQAIDRLVVEQEYGILYIPEGEYHVRSEIKMNNVHNWKFYALQTEEEKAEGMECLPVELVSCSDISFINLLMFRVVAVNRPYVTGVRLWDCQNIEILSLYNKAQMQYNFTVALQDKTSGFIAKAPEYARLTIKGKSEKPDRIAKYYKKLQQVGNKSESEYKMIACDNVFAQGAAFDEKGKLYWCDKTQKKIYKYDISRDMVKPFLDIHFVPAALATDTAGNLMVVADYSEFKTYVPGQTYFEFNADMEHPFFSWFYKRGERVYSVSLDNPYNTMSVIERVSAESVTPSVVYRPAHIAYYEHFIEIAEGRIDEYYMAPDGETALMASVDLARSLVLKKAVAGEKFVLMDDIAYRAYSFKVAEGGKLSEGELISEIGQYNCIQDKDDPCYTVADRLYGFRENEILCEKRIPCDAYALVENDGNVYLMGRSKVYRL